MQHVEAILTLVGFVLVGLLLFLAWLGSCSRTCVTYPWLKSWIYGCFSRIFALKHVLVGGNIKLSTAFQVDLIGHCLPGRGWTVWRSTTLRPC